VTVDVQSVGLPAMADKSQWNITKHQSLRIEPELWTALDPAAKAAGFTRAGLIRQFVRWYLRVPGAKLPQRPERLPTEEH
jgi:hypothetical protein